MKASNRLFVAAMILLVASLGLFGTIGYAIIVANTPASSEFTTATLPAYCLSYAAVDFNSLSRGWYNNGGVVSDAGLTFKMTSPGNQGIISKYIFDGDITIQADLPSFTAVAGSASTPSGQSNPSTSPSPTPTPSPTVTGTGTPSPSPTASPRPTPTPVPVNYGTTGLFLRFGDGNDIAMYWTKNATGSYLNMYTTINGTTKTAPAITLGSETVRVMKIVRSGSNAIFYADLGSGLVKKGTITGVLTLPVSPGIYTASSNSTTAHALKVVYNNFLINGCYKVVDPSTTSVSDDFSDTTLNQLNWENNNLNAVTLDNEQLKFTIPGGSTDATASVTSSYMVSGEFDAEIDLANVQSNHLNNGSLELDFDTPFGVHLYIVRYADSTGAHLATDVMARNGKYIGAKSVDLPDDSPVRVKIERKGADLISYYQTESGYTQLAYYSNVTTELGRFSLIAMSRINHPSVTAIADNFSLNGLSDEANAAYCSDVTEAFDVHTGDHWNVNPATNTLSNGSLTMKQSGVGAVNLASKYVYKGDVVAYVTVSKLTGLTTDSTYLSLESPWDAKNDLVLQWSKLDAKNYQMKLYSFNNGVYQEKVASIPSTTGAARLMIYRRKDVLSMYIDRGDGNGYLLKGSITGVHTLPVVPDLGINRTQAGQPVLTGVYRDLRVKGCYNVIDTASTNISDDFGSTTLNRRNWTYYGTMSSDNLVTINNAVNMSVPAGSTTDKYIGVASHYMVAGDFSAEVNLANLQVNSDQALAYLEFSGINYTQVDAMWVKGYANTHNASFNVGTKINTPQAKWEGNSADLPNSSVASGNLWVKIERRGSAFYLYYKTGNDYILGAVYTNISNGLGYLKLITGSQTSHPAATSVFKSFRLQSVATYSTDLPGKPKTTLDMANGGINATNWEKGAGITSDSNGTYYLKADPWLPNGSTAILSKTSFSADFSLSARVRVLSSTKLNPSATDNGHYGVTYVTAYGDDNNFMQFRIVRDAISGQTYVDFYGKNNGVLTDSNNVLTDNIQMATLTMNRVGNTVTLYENGVRVYQVTNVYAGAVRLGVGTSTSSNFSTTSVLWNLVAKGY